MTNDERSPNLENRNVETGSLGVSFELRISAFLRHSSFGFRHYPKPPLVGSRSFNGVSAGRCHGLLARGSLGRFGRSRLSGRVRLDGLDSIMLLCAVQLELDFLAHFAVQQRLGEWRQVTDDPLFRLGIPGPQDGKRF